MQDHLDVLEMIEIDLHDGGLVLCLVPDVRQFLCVLVAFVVFVVFVDGIRVFVLQYSVMVVRSNP